MVVNKQYLRYVPGSMFGIIGHGTCIHFITRFEQKEKCVAVPACEKVFVWDLRKKVKVNLMLYIFRAYIIKQHCINF